MRKRTLALAFLAIVAALVVATLLVLRTRWAGERLCEVAAARVEAATGLTLRVRSCRVHPLALALEADDVSLSRGDTPIFTAAAVGARLAPLQALGRRLLLEEMRAVRPRLSLPASPGGAGGTCPPPLLARLQVRRLDVLDGALDVGLPGDGRVAVEHLEVRSHPPARTLRSLASFGRRARIEVRAGSVAVTAGGQRTVATEVQADAELALDLSDVDVGDASARLGEARIGLAGRVRDLCAPRLDLIARAEGPAAALLALAGVRAEVTGTARVEARVAGSAASPALSGAITTRGVRAGHYVLGDAALKAHLDGSTLVVDRLAVAASGGEAVAKGTVRLGRGLPFTADVEATGVDLAEVLDRLGVTDPWITVRLDGKGHAAGTLSPPQVTGAYVGEVRGFKALTRSFRKGAHDPGVIAFARGRLEAPIRVDGSGLRVESARLTVGRGSLEADAEVGFSDERGFSFRCRGDADLAALGRVSSIPLGGRAVVEASGGAAPYGNPRITGRARAEGLRFLDLDLGAVSTDFEYDANVLRFKGAEGLRGATRYRAEVATDLGADPARIVDARVDARGRIRDLLDVVADWLPRTRFLRDVIDGDVEVFGTGTGPATAVDAAFDARLGPGAIYGRRYEAGRAAGTVIGGRTIRLDQAELRRGGGLVRAAGRWGVEAPFPWRMDLAAAGVPLAALDLPGGWEGTGSGTATLDGSYEHPAVKLAFRGEGVSLAKVPLGAVQGAGTIVERRLSVAAAAEGIDAGVEARLDGPRTFAARALLSFEDAGRLLPGGGPAGLRARVHGEATAEGSLDDAAQARAAVKLDRLQLSYADLRVEATAPAALEIAAGRIALQPLTLKGQGTALTVSGSRAAGGRLDLAAAGDLDLRLLGAVVPALRRAHGQLALEAHLGGTEAQPNLVGSGRVLDAGFLLRGSNVSFSSVRGALAFSQSRLSFDGLTGEVNGGPVTLRGEVELDGFTPSRLQVEAELSDVPVAVPAYLPVTLRGQLEAAGTPESTVVSGRLHVTRARYTADVDLEGSLLQVRRRPPPPRTYDKAGEWLELDVTLAVDGDARVDNDLVRGPLSGELTLTGTLAAPGVVGTLAMGEGSRVAFRGNEFVLTHAVLEFTERNRVEIALDVHGQSQVRDYEVYMHVFGSLARPEVTLTSVPSLPQPDIVTLLSLGFTRRDAAAGTGVGGVATAAAAQALFSASGLDDQVKRFLPRGGFMRNPSMRITSAYSEVTGQVEPRAEFESWLLRDRLRLRVQAPLGGGRGRNVMAELRLGTHTALQYQWENDNPDVATGDHGVDLKLRWEWTDDR